MIENLYIMKTNGVLLHSYSPNAQDDTDLITGFSASIANFGREALNTVVETIDFGDNKKLVLHPKYEEKLLLVAIAHKQDNIKLVTTILGEIAEEIIGKYAPKYTLDSLAVEQIISKSLKGKTVKSKALRQAISWLLIIPISIGLMFLSNFITLFMAELLGLNSGSVDLFRKFLPSIFLIAFILNMILYVGPSILFGFLSLKKTITIFNSIIYVGISLLMFWLFNINTIVFILMSNIPLSLLLSIVFSFLGVSLGKKKKLIS